METVAQQRAGAQRSGTSPLYQVLAEDIVAMGVEAVFGLISDDTALLATALDTSGARFYGARHENCAIAMADGYAYAAGRLGVAVIGRGPALANGLHGALLVGPRHPVGANAGEWLRALTSFDIDLACNGQHRDRGRAGNVMEGPLSTLRYVMDLLAKDRDNPPLAAGEIVTTGTLTKALPVAPGETWTTQLSGVALDGISVRFA